MAITVTARGSYGAATNIGTGGTFATGSFTPSADSLLVAYIGTQGAPGVASNGIASLAGHGTWTALTVGDGPSVGGNDQLLEVWWVKPGSSPGASAVTATNTTQTKIRATMSVFEITGIDDTAAVSAIILQCVEVNQGTAGLSGSVTLSAFADAANATIIGVCDARYQETITWDSPLTGIHRVVTGTEAMELGTAYYIGQDATPGFSWGANNRTWRAMALEVAAETSTFTGSGTPTQAPNVASGTGTFTQPTFTGSGTPAQQADTAAGTGVVTQPSFTGTGTPTQDDDTATGVGAYTPEPITGSGTPPQADQSSTGTGTFTQPLFTGTGTATQDAQTSTGTGSFTAPSFTGAGFPTQGDDVATGAGVFGGPGFTGSGSPVQADNTAAGTGSFTQPAFTGSGSPVQDDDTATGTGVFGSGTFTGTGSPTQADQTATGVGVNGSIPPPATVVIATGAISALNATGNITDLEATGTIVGLNAVGTVV